jgi:hypothetical protein
VSQRQSNIGDREGALESITEAVGHYRTLVEANPAAFLPNLATALNNLSNHQSDPSAIRGMWEAAVAGLDSHPLAQGELRAIYADYLSGAAETALV